MSILDKCIVFHYKVVRRQQFCKTAYVGKLNGTIIASIAAPIYESNFAFITIYYVDRKYQKNGFGHKMLTYCMDNLKNCKTIGLLVCGVSHN